MKKERSPITTHVLDLVEGRPAAGIAVVLEQEGANAQWKAIGKGDTDTDGRVEGLLPPASRLVPGNYRLQFSVRSYFERQKAQSFYPKVSIEFEVRKADEHYHVPLLLSRHGYSTYRGS